MDSRVDIKENYVHELNNELLEILLKDRSSNKNIIWATDNYKARGEGYYPFNNITIKAITKKNGQVIKPRVDKSKKEQTIRIKDKAEVFTPSWVCNAQNNLVDNSWFGRKGVFNVEGDKSWVVNKEKIVFPEGKTWKDYVQENRLEVSCGEAPYLASRYDTVTGQWLEIDERIGLLDRKLRVINENARNNDEQKKQEELNKGIEMVNTLLKRRCLSDECIEYFANDGIKKDTLDFLGICSMEHGYLEGRAIIPFLNENREICGYIAVNYKGKEWWVKKNYDKMHKIDSQVKIETIEKSYKI
jgi:hypothetical protein